MKWHWCCNTLTLLFSCLVQAMTKPVSCEDTRSTQAMLQMGVPDAQSTGCYLTCRNKCVQLKENQVASFCLPKDEHVASGSLRSHSRCEELILHPRGVLASVPWVIRLPRRTLFVSLKYVNAIITQ